MFCFCVNVFVCEFLVLFSVCLFAFFVCLFVFQRQRESRNGIGMVWRWRGPGKRRGEGNCDNNILYEVIFHKNK